MTHTTSLEKALAHKWELSIALHRAAFAVLRRDPGLWSKVENSISRDLASGDLGRIRYA